MADTSKDPRTVKPERKPKDNRLAIYGLTCALSLILFFAYATTNDTLNDDGINYIYAAHALSEGLLKEAKSYRPEVNFYRQISVISTLGGLDLYPSAQLLSLFWQVLLASGFIAIVRCFDTSVPGQLIALAVFFSMANLNHLRPDIIRGFGFWALQLWALWAGLHFVKHKAWRFAVLWLGFSAVSIIYRAEGIAYLFLIPIFALLSTCFTGNFTAKKGLKIAGVILFTGALMWLFLSPEPKQSPGDAYKLTQSLSFSATDKLQRELATFKLAADNFSQLKDDIATLMPNKWAQRSINDLLIGGFIFHLLMTLIKTTNAPLMALSLYRGGFKRPFFSDPQHKLLASYILTGILVGLMSVYNKYFLSTRYIMLTAILLAIAVTLVLSQTYRRLASSQQTSARLWKYSLFALPLLICVYPLSRQNDDKLYIREAGEWVKTHLNGEQNIYFNQQKVAFYTADYTNDSFKNQYADLEGLLREGYQYAVFYEGKAENGPEPLAQSLKEYRLKTFQNSRGRSVNVYKLPAPAP
jgi:hypothetical protein